MTEVLISASLGAEATRPLLEGLVAEYDALYGGIAGRASARSEIDRYPEAAFRAPHGDLLLLQRDGETIAGGAIMPHDGKTAEVKRVWTRLDLRKQGLSQRIMAALEARAVVLGYKRLYLTTGFRQPEAAALYLKIGFRPLFDRAVDPRLYRSLPFEKLIGDDTLPAPAAAVLPPAATAQEADARVKVIKARHEAWLTSLLAERAAAS